MQILTDNKNLIIGYAEVGGFEDGIDIERSILPDTFIAEFKPCKFKYENGKISYNHEYTEPDSHEEKIIESPQIEQFNEKMFKTMIATLQKQSVQSNMSVLKIQRENEDLKRRIEELENKSEVDDNVEFNE